MAFYESVFIARQDISSSQVDTLTEEFKGIVAEQGGTVGKTEYWGLRTLAYRIKKNRKGHYVLMNIDAPAGTVEELERRMRLNEDILRYLTVRVDALDENQSVMMQNKGERGGRDRDRDGRRRDRDDERGDREERGERRERREREEPKDAAEGAEA